MSAPYKLRVSVEMLTQAGKPAGDEHGNKYLHDVHEVPVNNIWDASDIRGRITAALHPGVTPISEPLTVKDEDADGWVEGVVEMDLNELFNSDFESIMDALSEKLVGDTLLMQIDYSVVGFAPGGCSVYIKVRGDAGMSFDKERQAR